MVIALAIPGIDRGKVVLMNVYRGFAPKSDDASKRFLSNLESTVYSGKMVTGK